MHIQSHYPHNPPSSSTKTILISSHHHSKPTHTMSITTPLLQSPPFKHKPLLPNPLKFSLITTALPIQPNKPLNFSTIKSHLTKPSKTTPFQNPLDLFCDKIFKTLKSITKPAITAILIGVLLTVDFNSAALAASGGRIGGSSFSRSSSSSSSSYSRSYSVPRGSSSGFSYSAPYYGGGGGGFYVGPAFGVGIGGGSSLLLILAGYVGFVLVSGFLSDRDEGGVLTAAEKTSVLKLQVGLLGMGRALQRDLNRIAEVADTSSPEGLSYVLTETSLALLRHPDYCISAYSSVDVKRSIEDGEKRFNQLSIEERGKFDEETLVNVNSIKRQSTSSRRSSGFNNEYIVITIVVAAEGVHKQPTINGGGDLKEALQKLASIPTGKLLAVEVLWTPQNENDTLSERELLEDYPLLRPL